MKKIYINILNSTVQFSALCSDDIQLTMQTTFQTFGEMIPSIGEFAGVVTTGQNAISGSISKGMSRFNAQLDAPRWQKTDPPKVSTTLKFFVRDDPVSDVWMPYAVLSNMYSLTKTENGYVTPGLSLKSIGAVANGGSTATINPAGVQTGTTEDTSLVDSSSFKDSTTKQFTFKNNSDLKVDTAGKFTFPNTSKLCAILIPNVIYIPVAYVENFQPMFSKFETKSKIPIWFKADITFSGVFPTNDDNIYKSFTKSSVVPEA